MACWQVEEIAREWGGFMSGALIFVLIAIILFVALTLWSVIDEKKKGDERVSWNGDGSLLGLGGFNTWWWFCYDSFGAA
jgi:large-conductance mechanosensitive channel